ncbi:MAG: deoxyribose-phosphate aldolase [Candidatus Kapaibacterium sp.]
MEKDEIKSEIASYIDHTNLKQDAKIDDIARLCNEAKQHGFAAVCVLPWYVRLAREHLDGSEARIATVVGFPLGATYTTAKVLEADIALLNGASELDMVINIAALKNREFKTVENDIESVAGLAKRKKAAVKVIIETAMLTDDELERAVNIAIRAGADYIKTSTGYAGGATAEAVRKIAGIIPENVKIKASGGIKTLDEALDMIEAGATRIGTSSAIEIMNQAASL